MSDGFILSVNVGIQKRITKSLMVLHSFSLEEKKKEASTFCLRI